MLWSIVGCKGDGFVASFVVVLSFYLLFAWLIVCQRSKRIKCHVVLSVGGGNGSSVTFFTASWRSTQRTLCPTDIDTSVSVMPTEHALSNRYRHISECHADRARSVQQI